MPDISKLEINDVEYDLKDETKFPKDGSGEMTGDVKMGGFKIANLGDATEDGDAISKKQAETLFAPSGLSGFTTAVSNNNDIDSTILQALQKMKNHSLYTFVIDVNVNGLDLLGGTWHITICRVTADYATITAIKYNRYNADVLYRSVYDGVLTPWCWENPPMELGVEYRTTKRLFGQPIYIKAIWGGALPNAGYSQIMLTLADGSSPAIVDGRVIETTASSSSNITAQTLRNIAPWNNNAGNGINVNFSQGNVVIWCTIDRSSNNCIIIFEYIKY